MKITLAASSAARIAASFVRRWGQATVLEFGDDVARDDGPTRQFGLIQLDRLAGGAKAPSSRMRPSGQRGLAGKDRKTACQSKPHYPLEAISSRARNLNADEHRPSARR
jgi:hypothetical protein